ncbi:D-alanine aminotransferase [Neorhodopirellula pilleata]|uniref:D-alanine aminotransferase n=1 Tax=Neorhodopirellula pilleata TaxID=2714738 RepID=A0A5C6AVR2_9BACT|nr:D-alanine aminotransferase [Neorhodopirellula pilleata]
MPIEDLGFRQGVTAVERLRTYDRRPFAVDRHLQRFAQTLRSIGMDASVSMDAIERLIDEIIDRNRDWVSQQVDVGITVWATPGRRLSNQGGVTYAVHLNPIDHEAVRIRRTEGQSVVLTDIRQPAPDCWPRSAKVRSRLHYFLADQQSESIRRGSTGVLRDEDDSWTESSVANLALVVDDELVFAPVDRVLPGVTQCIVREIAWNQGIDCRNQLIQTVDIGRAQAMLLMGTDTGLWFASEVWDGQGNCIRSFDRPTKVSLTKRLQTAMPQSSTGLPL